MIKQRRQRGDKAKARNPNTCAANGQGWGRVGSVDACGKCVAKAEKVLSRG